MVGESDIAQPAFSNLTSYCWVFAARLPEWLLVLGARGKRTGTCSISMLFSDNFRVWNWLIQFSISMMIFDLSSVMLFTGAIYSMRKSSSLNCKWASICLSRAAKKKRSRKLHVHGQSNSFLFLNFLLLFVSSAKPSNQDRSTLYTKLIRLQKCYKLATIIFSYPHLLPKWMFFWKINK